MIAPLAALLSCTLISVTDGDTFRAACPAPVTVRIADIDAPERRTCPTLAARSATTLAALLTGTITLQPLYTDRYHRTVALVSVDGQDVGTAMLASQSAYSWPHNDKGRALTARPNTCAVMHPPKRPEGL